MKWQHKGTAKLFGSGFLQVILVAVNTYQIANGKVLGALVVGFLISFTWSFNVKRIAFGTLADRVVYSLGAAVGSAGGLLLASLIYG